MIAYCNTTAEESTPHPPETEEVALRAVIGELRQNMTRINT